MKRFNLKFKKRHNLKYLNLQWPLKQAQSQNKSKLRNKSLKQNHLKSPKKKNKKLWKPLNQNLSNLLKFQLSQRMMKNKRLNRSLSGLKYLNSLKHRVCKQKTKNKKTNKPLKNQIFKSNKMRKSQKLKHKRSLSLRKPLLKRKHQKKKILSTKKQNLKFRYKNQVLKLKKQKISHIRLNLNLLK